MGLFNRKIISVEILNSSVDSKKSATSSLMRGAVGGALLGPAGLLAGGLSGKNKMKQMTTFLIKYDDGYQMTQTVENNGLMFNTYMQLIKKQKSEVKQSKKETVNNKYDKLSKLKELLDSNAITQEEFQKEKEKILDE